MHCTLCSTGRLSHSIRDLPNCCSIGIRYTVESTHSKGSHACHKRIRPDIRLIFKLKTFVILLSRFIKTLLRVYKINQLFQLTVRYSYTHLAMKIIIAASGEARIEYPASDQDKGINNRISGL